MAAATTTLPTSAASEYHRSDDAEAYAKNAAFVYGDEAVRPVLQLLNAQPGEKILDVGCGNGQLTMRLSHLVGSTGRIEGTDASAKMIHAAQTSLNAADDLVKSNTTYQVIDAHNLDTWLDADSNRRFDKAFSNAALHWMKNDPRKVVANVYKSLRPGGMFAAEMGGFLNVVGVRGALHTCLRHKGLDAQQHDPWYFPTLQSYKKILEEEGFKVELCELVPRPTPLPQSTGLEGWLKTFIQPFTSALATQQEQDELFREVIEMLRPDCYDAEQDIWTLMNVRLRFRAVRPASST
ncbi:S-adenosyl-L-methionine-dependent methyltransferase [Ceraceosorus guamensis]|uniref:S-adenosyl-L-methionine-dependent methyltransferase n=1 Tax=Ceraceosorus guamensis TaxID=1522189 RepID=A0A316VX03_9BASI|nr:S-adenosyl-L-methionine-dependent methyltransferase [Ceraceosorus guamensis]PWN40811.1 S-adenosyl-L-methionine-dependent methyltransferase [Ceraceosorus guamensis]